MLRAITRPLVRSATALMPALARRLESGAAHEWIEVAELARVVAGQSSTVIIDVRQPVDFDGPLGHISGARNIPLAELPQRVRELSSVRREPIVLVCRTHRMSASAAAQLQAAGFTDVRVLRGGMVQWNESGHAVAGRTVQSQVADRSAPTGSS